MSLVAGVARADVTPPVGINQSGYAARTDPSIGIHDDLACTALYLEQGDVCAAIVALDLIDVEADQTRQIRERCEERAGIAREHVFVAASHTHGGPTMGPGEDDPIRAAYWGALQWTIAGAVAEARERAVAARLGHAQKECLLAGNRRQRTPDGQTTIGHNPDAPTTRTTDVLRVDSPETGQTIAILFEYGCHATTVGPDNLWLTADYPGVARRLIERELPGVRAMFLRGFGANMNPHPRGTFEHVRRHGTRLGASVLCAALDIDETRDVETLRVHSRHTSLPLADLPSVEECRKELAAAEAAAEAERQGRDEGAAFDRKVPLSWATNRRLKGTKEMLAAANRGETDLSIPVEIQAMAFDDIAIAGFPAEAFMEIGQRIREHSPFPVTLPVDHANGAIGYIPTAEEVPFGGYEVLQSRARRHGLFIRDDADEALVQEVVAALRGL